MPRCKVRTLLIVLAIGPPVLASAWPTIQAKYDAWRYLDIRKNSLITISGNAPLVPERCVVVLIPDED